MLGAILREPWKPDPQDKGTIIGKWAEDGNEYYIAVPHQLRDDILAMQNALAHKYIEIEKTKSNLQKLEPAEA